MDNTQKERNIDPEEYVYTWGLFATLETLENFVQQLKTKVKFDRKKHLSNLQSFIRKWKANTSQKNRLQYAQVARPEIEELSFLLMEVNMFTSAVPLEQIDFFSHGLKKLQMECIQRQDKTKEYQD